MGSRFGLILVQYAVGCELCGTPIEMTRPQTPDASSFDSGVDETGSDDAGSPLLDGGPAFDGGVPFDGGPPSVDGGFIVDAGSLGDGGPSDGGTRPDAGLLPAQPAAGLRMVYAQRKVFTLTALGDGRALATGGSLSDGGLTSVVEIFDPASNQWSAAPDMPFATAEHAATFLPAVNAVLVTGGGQSFDRPMSVAALYDVTGRTWTRLQDMSVARTRHRATRLLDGQVLVCGGQFDPFGPGTPATDCQRFRATSARSGTWTAAAPLPWGRFGQIQYLLPNGNVFVSGGAAAFSSHLYDPTNDRWSDLAPMGFRSQAQATAWLANDIILAVGGWRNGVGVLSDSILIDPLTGNWSSTAPAPPDLNLTTNDVWSGRFESGNVLFSGRWLFNATSQTWVQVPGPSNVYAQCVRLLMRDAVLCARGDNESQLFVGL